MNTEMMTNIDRSKIDDKPKRGALNGFNDWMRIQEHKKAYWLSQTGKNSSANSLVRSLNSSTMLPTADSRDVPS